LQYLALVHRVGLFFTVRGVFRPGRVMQRLWRTVTMGKVIYVWYLGEHMEWTDGWGFCCLDGLVREHSV
jgi:hypothetical protein